MGDSRGTSGLDELTMAFCQASIRGPGGRAYRMLAAQPEIATHGLAPAIVLGDVERVRAEVEEDQAAAARVDAQTGWTPLHLACSSRWHRIDPSRADGITAVAQLLLDAGASPTEATSNGWTPLRCAVAGIPNASIVRMLLDRGAQPDDSDVYLACFGDDEHETLRLLLERMPDVSKTTALAAPISTGDIEGVRILLAAGADPHLPSPADLYGASHDGQPDWPPVHAAIYADCSVELVRLLLEAGGDPNAVGPDGRTPHQLAIRRGRTDLAQLVGEHGGDQSANEVDLLILACLRADRPEATQALERLRIDELSDADYAVLPEAAEKGNGRAVELMLDLGFPIGARGDNGATALHVAAYNGHAEIVRALIARGAALETRDTTWDSTPLGWAVEGSGQQHDDASRDWVATIEALLDAGARTDGVTLSGDDETPSADVAQLLRARGIS